MNDSDAELIAAATAARVNAWAPMSDYRVGAAIRCEDGTIVAGCNVEHVVLPLTCCAEQVAIHTAVAMGQRLMTAVAVVTNSSPPASPCGACRQVLVAWGVSRVVMANDRGEVVVASMSELLPLAFGAKDLGRGARGA